MEKYYSKISKNLLHIVFRKAEMTEGRQDIVDAEHFLQCSSLNLKAGHTFKPHKHISKNVPFIFPQESWTVMKGKVKCIFYDIDDTILCEPILEEGDVSFSLGGGHNYLVLEDALVYEHKVGPYLGQELDKQFIK